LNELPSDRTSTVVKIGAVFGGLATAAGLASACVDVTVLKTGAALVVPWLGSHASLIPRLIPDALRLVSSHLGSQGRRLQ